MQSTCLFLFRCFLMYNLKVFPFLTFALKVYHSFQRS